MRGLKKLNTEMDILKLLRRVRSHDIVLKSSILCSKGRRNLLKHTSRCIVDGPEKHKYC
jgi:hypothetical protein